MVVYDLEATNSDVGLAEGWRRGRSIPSRRISSPFFESSREVGTGYW